MTQQPPVTWPTARNDRTRRNPFYPPDGTVVPRLYGQEKVPAAEVVVHLHYSTRPGIVGVTDAPNAGPQASNGGTVNHRLVSYRPEESVSHWYITEVDNDGVAFGFACLNGWTDLAEWGYVDLKELESVPDVVRDVTWTPTKVADATMVGFDGPSEANPEATDELGAFSSALPAPAPGPQAAA